MMDELIRTPLDGDQALAIKEARRLRGVGVGSQKIVMNGVEAAMNRLDEKCTVEQFNLLEIMLCGRACMGVMKEILPLDAIPQETKGTIVVGALEGDVHDLGRNILRMVLTASGYHVIDAGKDCFIDRLIDEGGKASALAIGVSGLITTVIPQVRHLKSSLTERGLGQIKVIAGGGALRQSSAENLRVDFVAQSAFEGLHYIASIGGGKE